MLIKTKVLKEDEIGLSQDGIWEDFCFKSEQIESFSFISDDSIEIIFKSGVIATVLISFSNIIEIMKEDPSMHIINRN